MGKGSNIDGNHPPSYEDVEEQKQKDIPKIKGLEDGQNNMQDDKEGGAKVENQTIGFFELFKFADKLDVFLILFGLLVSTAMGVAIPILCVLFGDALQAFVDDDMMTSFKSASPIAEIPSSYSGEPMMEIIARFGYVTIALGFIVWGLSWIFVSCLNYAAARQVFKIRCQFLQAVLRQDIAWYDTSTSNDFASRMTEDLNKVQEGIGEKIGMLMFTTSTLLCSLITAFIYGWDLTLIIMTMIPLMIIFGGIAAKVQSSFAEKEMAAYGKAGAIAEEALSAIRTVVAFGGQQKEVQNYTKRLAGAKKSGILRGMLTGVSGGLMFGIMYCVYALGFWYGITTIIDDLESSQCQACDQLDLECFHDCTRYNAGSILVVFFSILIGGFQIAQSAPYVESINTARISAGKIFKIIERIPRIDSSSKDGVKLPHLNGTIKFENVHFNYPSRKDVKILQGLNLTIPKGKTVALVGSSGCGKSTCVQLAQRFYDPDSGNVFIDGYNMKDLNVGWLRDHIGVVGQEPVLFDLNIRENIRLGNLNATDEQIEKACKEANAYKFIMKLPMKFETMVGEGGTQLSGGQKQRIAIARALVRNPKILLLDEATSALDTESEKIVQAALEYAGKGRTTIVVAHRLSTIRSADIIVGLHEGQVKEIGNHQELMRNKDLYYNLVMRQTANTEEQDKDTSESSDDEETVQSNSYSEQQSLEANDAEKGNDLVPRNSMKTEEEAPKIQLTRTMMKNSPEWFYITIGVLASAGMGAVMPLFGIVFGDMLGVLTKEPDIARNEIITYALYFVALGIFAFLTQFLQGLMFSISGEKLTSRLRTEAFAAMLRQEMGWYDKTENSTGALCARLAGDCSKIQGATGAKVGTVMQGVAGILIAIIIGLVYNWQLGLVCSVFLPLTIVAVILEQRIIVGADSIEKVAFEESAKLAVEAISNIRTVASLRCEERYIRMYTDRLSLPFEQNKKKSHVRGVLFGFSQAIQYFAWGATLWFGGYLVDSGDATYPEVFTVQHAIIGAAGIIGYSFAFVSDFNKAMVAASKILSLLDRKPLIDSNPSAGLKLPDVKGNIEIKDAKFHYPTRPKTKILQRLQLSIKNGESIALVGESGCGKSTVIQLIQRLYDLESGFLDVEKQSIEALNLPWLRSKIGLVSQEPILFDRTIAENIKYGDNERDVSMEEVIEAARKANIHNFVSSLPSGYATNVGNKGSKLSGGQKQRIAIARALVRNPRILLLDEATSALDTESEKIVQDALDAAQVGRTSITIAHRLSTIKNVDQIYVIVNGQVVDHGKHNQLLKTSSFYSKLWYNSVH